MRIRQLPAILSLFLFVIASEGFAKGDIVKNELISEGKKRSYIFSCRNRLVKINLVPY